MSKAVRIITYFFVALIATGCGSILSGAGPSSTAIIAEKSDNYQTVDLTAATIMAFVKAPAPMMVDGPIKVTYPRFIISRGDVLRVAISDSSLDSPTFASLASGGTVFDGIRVDDEGKIEIPYAGPIDVVGLTQSEATRKIRDALKRRVAEPEVHVQVASDNSNSVVVAGAVKAPGRYSALQGATTLLDAINLAQGPILEPHLVRVVLRTTDGTTTYTYQEILDGNNARISPNSEIVVERARQRFIAMGAVGRPGLHDLPSAHPSLLEVIGSVGGLDERRADPSGVFVFRSGAEEGYKLPTVFRLNMKDPAAIFIAQKFEVRPDDAVFVTNAAVYEWQKIISPIVQVLVLGRTIEGI